MSSVYRQVGCWMLIGTFILCTGCSSKVEEQGRTITDDPILRSSIAESIPASECDSNYEGACVPLVNYDLDCADVKGPVYVVGEDVHRFDRDKNGIGCEPYP